MLALSYTLWYFTQKNNFCISRNVFSLDWRIAKDALAIGMGPFLMNSASCIVTMFINRQLLKYGGDLAIGAYGIVNRINFLFVMIILGFNRECSRSQATTLAPDNIPGSSSLPVDG